MKIPSKWPRVNTPQRDRRGAPGQTLVEFALILPLLIFVVLGIIEFGLLFLTYTQTSNQLRAALRYGVIPGENEAAPQYVDCAGIESIARDVLFADSQSVTIDYVRQDGTTAACGALTADDIETGYQLRLVVDTTVGTVTPPFRAIYPTFNFNLEGRRTIIKQVLP